MVHMQTQAYAQVRPNVGQENPAGGSSLVRTQRSLCAVELATQPKRTSKLQQRTSRGTAAAHARNPKTRRNHNWVRAAQHTAWHFIPAWTKGLTAAFCSHKLAQTHAHRNSHKLLIQNATTHTPSVKRRRRPAAAAELVVAAPSAAWARRTLPSLPACRSSSCARPPLWPCPPSP